MTEKNLCLILFLLFRLPGFSQDIIIKSNGDTIKAKVLTVGIHDIEYRKADRMENLMKSEISYIFYPNGVSDTFTNVSSNTHSGYGGLNISLAERGTMDAKMYYKGYRGAMIGSALGSVYYIIGGFIPAVICASTPPRYEKLNFPDSMLMEKAEYREAYEQKAFKIKKGKTWEGFGIGAGVCVVLVAIIVEVALSSY